MANVGLWKTTPSVWQNPLFLSTVEIAISLAHTYTEDINQPCNLSIFEGKLLLRSFPSNANYNLHHLGATEELDCKLEWEKQL